MSVHVKMTMNYAHVPVATLPFYFHCMDLYFLSLRESPKPFMLLDASE